MTMTRIKRAFLAALGVLLLCAQPAFAQIDTAARGMTVNAKGATSRYVIADRLLTAALRPKPTSAPISVTVSDNLSTSASLNGVQYDGAFAFGDTAYFQNVGAPYKTGNTAPIYNNGGVLFGTDAPEIEFWMRAGKWELWVDGVQVSTSPFTSAADGFKRVTFPDARQRNVELRFRKSVSNISGLTVRKPYSIWRVAAPPTVYVMGDSIADGPPYGDLTNSYEGWPARLGRLTGWDTWSGGTGGSGYTAVPIFTDRVSSIPTDAAMVIAAGGINDSGASTGALQTAVTTFVSAVRTRCPNAFIVVLGPWRGPGQAPSQPYSDAIKAGFNAVADNNMLFVDTYAENWQFGSGGGYGGLQRSGTLTFTGALTAATSGTLTSGWVGATGSYTVAFDGGSAVGGITKTVTLTQSSTSVTWTGAVTATASAFAWQSTSGNSDLYFSNDLIHPSTVGHQYLAQRVNDSIVKWLRSIVAERGVVVGSIGPGTPYAANDNYDAPAERLAA